MSTKRKRRPPPPPPSSSTKVREKSVYLLTNRCDDEKSNQTSYVWYKIDTSDVKSGPPRKPIPLFSEMPSFFSSKPCFVASGPIIYALGSRSDRSSSPEVYLLDTRCPDMGWKKGPSMIIGRHEPYAAVIYGKIYVMGDNYAQDNLKLWGEVLDPLLNEWKPMPPPNDPTVRENFDVLSHAVLEDGGKRRILVYLGFHLESLFCYDIESETWSVVDEKFDAKKRVFQTPCAVVDNLMYFYSRKVRACDFGKRRWLQVKGLEAEGVTPPLCDHNGYGSPDRDDPKAFLVHLGNGSLCLVWSHESLRVHCTKFRICQHNDGEEEIELCAVIESFRVYTLDKAEECEDCLAL